jgi:hypothetical protein
MALNEMRLVVAVIAQQIRDNRHVGWLYTLISGSTHSW